MYQAASLILGYSYGYFEGKELLKVGGVLTLVEGIFLREMTKGNEVCGVHDLPSPLGERDI